MYLQEYVPYLALSISIIALFFVVRNFRRKSGMHIKGQFGISSSAHAEDKYVSHITLENQKDRAVIIFKIFLKVGNNYYIELENFEYEPKILKPYESYSCQYGPVDFYCVNMNRIKLNNLMDSNKLKNHLVLSTSQGRYIVEEWIKRWDPVFDFFNNHMTAYIQPMRPEEKKGYYGSDFKYLVKLTMEDGYKRTVPIYDKDYNYPRFEGFRLTKDAMSSKSSLDEFLTGQAINGKLSCVDVEVFDAKELREESYGSGFEKTFEAKYYNWFQYYILGKILTKLSDVKLYFSNKKIKKG